MAFDPIRTGDDSLSRRALSRGDGATVLGATALGATALGATALGIAATVGAVILAAALIAGCVVASLFHGTAVNPDSAVRTGQIAFDHPVWGPSILVTSQSVSPTETAPRLYASRIVALDASGEVRWQHAAGDLHELAPADPPVDDTGHLFLNYNPGRYNGVIILNPSADGFQDFRTLPEPGGYEQRFYSAELEDTDADGTYEVISRINTCKPDCASANPRPRVFRWDGHDYVLE